MAEGMSPSETALVLTRLIAWSEGKNITGNGGNASAATREYLLWTYAQCLRVVQEPMDVKDIVAWPIPK